MQPDRLIDLVHLDSQTFGDAALARELLTLFDAQCRRLLPAIRDATLPADARADHAHTLKGSALGVGAARAAAQSAVVEDALRKLGAAEGHEIDTLVRIVDATLAEIGGLAAGRR